jgi:phage-related minor tail protein
MADAMKGYVSGTNSAQAATKKMWETMGQQVTMTGLYAGMDAMHQLGSDLVNGGASVDKFFAGLVKSILDALPAQLLSAGLQACITGNWTMGIALIAASGLVAMAGGAADAQYQKTYGTSTTANANGNVFDAGRITPFAAGGIVSRPTFFPMANGGIGLMGEAGTEGVFPLGRNSKGELGVKSTGGGGDQMVHSQIVLDGKVLYDAITRASRDRKILIDRNSIAR